MGKLAPKITQECAPGTHVLIPHSHTRLEDGRVTPCGGRFWCVRCRRWQNGRPCKAPGMMPLPKGWR